MADPREIIAEIDALTVHCRPPLMDVEQRGRWQRDWAQDLAKYPIEAIQSAIRQWRQGESLKFPTPGQLLPMVERASGSKERRDEAPTEWRYDLTDGEYRALSLHDKIRHHGAAANYCRVKAGPMPHLGAAVAKDDMPSSWHAWRQKADNHDAEAARLRRSIGALEQRA